jgi:hypothetical protein
MKVVENKQNMCPKIIGKAASYTADAFVISRYLPRILRCYAKSSGNIIKE